MKELYREVHVHYNDTVFMGEVVGVDVFEDVRIFQVEVKSNTLFIREGGRTGDVKHGAVDTYIPVDRIYKYEVIEEYR
jgi:hypothetical protein